MTEMNLTILSRYRKIYEPENRNRWFCDCICFCGKRFTVLEKSIKNKSTLSCGCYGKSQRKKRLTKHGMKNTVEYRTWKNIRSRCNSPKGKYRKKNIKICKRWDDFLMFFEDMGERPSAKHSIDRIDGSKGYSPDNCRWATAREQNINKDCIKKIEFYGVSLSICEWADVFEVPASTMYGRRCRGLTDEQILLGTIKKSENRELMKKVLKDHKELL